jgi:hypothetical protein
MCDRLTKVKKQLHTETVYKHKRNTFNSTYERFNSP